MTLSAASVTLGPQGPRLAAAPPLPLEALLLGKPVTEAADLLPRLFNLCRHAQGLAARLSLGLPAGDTDTAAEVIRDHVARLCVTLRRAFDMAPLPLPADPAALLGRLPQDGAGLADWLAGPAPVAGLARRIVALFPPGAACCPPLPRPADPLAAGAFENSAAGRQADHPLLRQVEAAFGRGPLWRYLGLLADLEAALARRLPPPTCRDGIATVPAARGAYALRLSHAGGLITGITRRTPTDHLLAPGGALLQSLASLPAALHPLAPQVIALHDPCIPVTLCEAQHA
ncbi:HupK protein [Rhodobacter sp. Har01]|uniref:HupK protein n=1 Tax=Rhodobacter sp. Har01 TaxID=2883999 RepID=UPI001D076F18|nr:HupK protein [Rhodobacter sp. Har01]MCB6176689.1 HupK protein [Rhodobacter sp. Har01]